ncbi:hypothetical protein EDD18DRAFT_1411260 [Armillaria luteobubalina]|uniref:Uncharacterized protein n=1 Tax=Armillaria luteobubalina TaxID=153913 RepID=A0AA39QLC2_9AGAR|nr:hypothetical protein EDD18DRAFT_1411260 [Armillaria luteobubalina]
MANLLRIAKSGSNWGQNELHAYNIVVEYQDAATFFGVDPLPQPPVATELLRNTLGYMRRPNVTSSRLAITCFICGEQRDAKPNICIVSDSNEILLLVQEDKQDMEAEPQLIAEAIAAFQANNYERRRLFGQGPIAHKVMSGTILTGTSPVFYKIHVTTELADNVSLGQYPPTRTVVCAHLPPVPRPACRLDEGMRPLDNRAIILSCYEAFKKFVD